MGTPRINRLPGYFALFRPVFRRGELAADSNLPGFQIVQRIGFPSRFKGVVADQLQQFDAIHGGHATLRNYRCIQVQIDFMR